MNNKMTDRVRKYIEYILNVVVILSSLFMYFANYIPKRSTYILLTMSWVVVLIQNIIINEIHSQLQNKEK